MQQVGNAGKLGTFGDAARVRVVAGGQPDQFTDAQGKRQCRVLQHHSDVAARADVLRVTTEQADFACIGADQSEKQSDCGGLAGAVRAEQSQQFALAQAQVDAFERAQCAVSLADALQTRQYVFRLVAHGTLPG